MDNQNNFNNVNYRQPQGYNAPVQVQQPVTVQNAQNQNINYQLPRQQYQPVSKYAVSKKVYRPFSQNDSVFLLLFFIVTFVFIDFSLFKGFHLGFTISYFLIFIVSTLFVKNKNTRFTPFPVVCGALSLVASVSFSLYYNALVNVIMAVLIAGLLTIYLLGISESANRKFGNFKMLFELAEASIIKPFENIGDVMGSMKASASKGKRYLSSIIGVLIALPVLLVVIPLLVKSDAAFEGLIKIIAKNIGIYIAELVLAVVFLPYVFSYMFGKKYKINKKDSALIKNEHRVLNVSGCVSFLCVISLTYAVYMFSQLAYFFSAFSGFLPKDYTRTASAFARRGFFEMFAICVINVLIISAVSAFSKKNIKGKTSVAIKLFSCFISLFSLLLIATAMQKMRLNISTYGFTVNRLLISVLMLMELVIFAFFIVHIFAPKVNYMQPIIIICSAMFIALSFANIDGITAAYNIKAYENNTVKTLDVNEIGDMGVDTMPYLADLAKSNDKAISHKAELELIKLLDSEAYTNNQNDFRSYYKAKKDAVKAVDNYKKSLNKEHKKAFDKTVKMMKEDNYEYTDWDGEDYFFNINNDKYYLYNEKTGAYDIEMNSDDFILNHQ